MPETLSSLIHPEPGPTLGTFERLAPPAPLNVVAAEIEARSRPGDVVVDLFGRGGWVARTAVADLRRSYTLESTPLTRLLAEVVLRPPDVRHFDAAVQSLAAHPRGDGSLRQWITGLYASRCPTCGRNVTVDEFIWDGEAEAPFRKSYRCTTCRDQIGGGEQRTATTDAADASRAGEIPDPDVDELLTRFPVGQGIGELPRLLLGLYTPRTLAAFRAILERLDSDLRAAPIEGALRLALLHAVLPASKLNSYPGRVAALRISSGHVRLPGGHQWRERNPWLLFEDGCRLVRGFIQRVQALHGGPVQARFGDDLRDLADATANVVLRTGLGRSGGTGRPRSDLLDRADPRIRLVLTQPPIRWTTESLSFAYHATSLVLGADAAATLPLDGLAGPAPRFGWGWEAASLERGLGTIRPILAPDARAVVMLEPGGPEGLVAGALGGVGAGYRLVRALLAEGADLVGGTLEFTVAPPHHTPLSRAGVPLPDGQPVPAFHPTPAGGFQLAAVERDVTDTAVEILRARGEPARFERLLGEILVGLDEAGHLRSLVGTRSYGEQAARDSRTTAALGLFGERLTPPPSMATAGGDGSSGGGGTTGETAADAGSVIAGSAISGSAIAGSAISGSAIAGSEATARPDAGLAAPGAAEPGTAAAATPDPELTAAAGPIAETRLAPGAQRGSDPVNMLLELIQHELSRPDNPRLEEVEPGRWWLRDERDADLAAVPLSDRVEWAVFSLLATTGGLSEAAFYDRIAAMFRGHDTPDQSLVQACLESYRSRASTPEMLMTGDELQARYREHTELVGLLVDYGHRLGLRCWVSPKEQKRPYRGHPLGAQLSELEERAYLPLASRGPVDVLESVDCMWYQRNRAAFIFEVEWTAMVSEAVLRRGRRIPQDDSVVRFLVVLPERVELLRYKLARSPLLRSILDQDNWHILKANHLRTIVSREGADLERLEPFLGLDPEIERQGEQLPLFE
ncbi:MAG: hypothetical protein M0Z49_09470 [Chloroflexi bacterium]|nr:hypothetical protein [Chloroflexota bacterium]